jgi:long-chain acyl-CoA synthetase
MEASIAPDTTKSTGSATIADLMAAAAERYSDRVAARHKVDGAWQDVTFAEAGEIASEIGRGLIDLGIVHGDRVCILANTRPEWTYADFGITSTGAVVVPIYQTNSPAECEWVAGNSEARAIVCEDAAQVAKITEVRGNLPNLEHVIVIDTSGDVGDAISLDDLRERGRGRDEAELRERSAAVSRDDSFTIIYTSGTTGPPKGCVLSHGNYRDMLSLCQTIDVLNSDDDEVIYLFLPLAHSFALLIQLLSFDGGHAIAYFGGNPKAIVPELSEVHPTYLPSVPRIFEKIYTLATTAILKEISPEQLRGAVGLGVKVRDLEYRGEPVPPELAEPFKQFDEQVAQNVRDIFGGRVHHAVTGAAPIAQEILEFFYACGVPVLEGYGMTETATAATYSTLEDHKFGTVGKPFPGVELKIAEDGELLVKGPNIFQGYYRNDDASFGAVIDGWLHTGDLGAIDEDGYLSIVGRKKDIIITAGGKNLTPANIENDLKQNRWISQAVMHGDRRPFPVVLITLDPEEAPALAAELGLESDDIPTLAQAPEVHERIQAVLDEVNEGYAQVEQVKKFVILDHDLSQETGELTPTLKVKRNVVNEKYATLFDELYA